MAGFSFKRREDIERVLKLSRQSRAARKANRVGVLRDAFRQLAPVGLFQTPSGGIAARSGIDVSSADCEVFYINGDDELTELLQTDYTTANDTASHAVPVYNLSTTAVAGDTYIQAILIWGDWIAVEGGGSSPKKVLKTPTGGIGDAAVWLQARRVASPTRWRRMEHSLPAAVR